MDLNDEPVNIDLVNDGWVNDDEIDPQILAALATSIAETPPAGLRARTIRAALAARAGGGPPDQPPSGALDAFFRQVATFDDLLGTVDDWHANVDSTPDAPWDPQQVLAHAVEVERYFGSVLGLWSYERRGPEHDHHAMTAHAVDAAHSHRPEALVAAWRADIGAIRRHLGAGPLPERISFHTLDMRAESCLALRAFELWTHSDDIRRACGLPLAEPMAADMAILANTAVELMPLGMAIRGVGRPDDTVRVVLSGPGGGTWLAPLGPRAPEAPTLTLFAEVTAFCRYAARRLALEELRFDIEGDQRVGRDVLVGASAFAA
jgi:uncharacterized protein (TIGR03083 family)